MYSYAERMKAVQLYIKLGRRMNATILADERFTGADM
ncbi:putative transposase-like protein [Advenella mimigardefordensis DPN7]|uniref:Putative transposase-like protein n=1 Tax=Advenella mimigardefordensis (strain DSM 17166 / LMG 22922 / DPN7) TaxID=1247726 RepID=W0PLH2_ADVMD|nr:putative transposase-like protein [Advenella mimigardefordensis DPN7]